MPIRRPADSERPVVRRFSCRLLAGWSLCPAWGFQHWEVGGVFGLSYVHVHHHQSWWAAWLALSPAHLRFSKLKQPSLMDVISQGLTKYPEMRTLKTGDSCWGPWEFWAGGLLIIYSNMQAALSVDILSFVSFPLTLPMSLFYANASTSVRTIGAETVAVRRDLPTKTV